MGLSKKAFFFTFIALLLTTIFIVLFSSNPALSPRPTIYSDKAKIEVINSITKDLKDVFLPRVMLSSSKIALGILIQHISDNSMPIDDINLRAEELLLNGTLYGAYYPVMANHTLNNWSRKISKITKEHFRIITNITFINIRVYQTDPWKVTFAAEVIIKNNYSDTIYDIQDEILSNISIIGYNDPLFLIHSQNRSIIRAATVTWNLSETINHIANNTFTYFNRAPSFIMRMENDTGASSCCGIESILNSSFGNYNYSYIDYLFWNQTYSCGKSGKYGKLFNVTAIGAMPSGTGLFVKFDPVHYPYYGITYDEKDEDICSP